MERTPCSLCKPRLTAKDPLPHWNSEDKHPGWYSRRHQTQEARDAARVAYQSQRGPSARRRKAQERAR